MSSRSHRGYMALITILILTFALTVLAAAAGEAGFFARMNTSDLENQLTATHLARSCAAVATLRSVQEDSFTVAAPGIEFPIGEEICHINATEVDGQAFSITASARVGMSMAHVMNRFRIDTHGIRPLSSDEI